MAAAAMTIRRAATSITTLSCRPFKTPYVYAAAAPLFRSFNADSQEVTRGYTGTDDRIIDIDSGGDNGGGDRSLSHHQDRTPTFLSGAFDPFSPTRSLNQMMNLMDQFMDNPLLRAGGGTGRGWAVKENDKELRLRLDMPGLSKEDVKISVEQNTLVIRGEADHDNDGNGRRYSSRIDLIPSQYNVNEIKAEMRNGVLKVAIPKVGDEERKDVVHVQVE